MAWTGFGGSWNDGVHSGGDDSGSIGGGGIKLDGKGNPVGSRAPNASDIANQFNEFGGIQINASQVSNIRPDGEGGYTADISGHPHTVSDDLGGSKTSNTLGGFTGVSTGSGNGGSNKNGNGATDWNEAAKSVRAGVIPSNFVLKNGKVGIKAPKYQKISAGHGEYTEVYKGTEFVEVPSLTAAYNEGVRQRDIETLLKDTTDIIVGSGEKISGEFGKYYQTLAKEISTNLRNFQGKTIRSYTEAMNSLNKVMNNPGTKVNRADKAALVNAWRAFDTNSFAGRFVAVEKTFKRIDIAQKANTIREKSIVGWETGNWGPLMSEVAAMVASDVFSKATLAVVGAIVTAVLTSSPLAVTLVMAGAIIATTIIASYIDANLVDKVFNQLIPKAH